MRYAMTWMEMVCQSGDTTEQQAYRNAFGLAAGANHNCAGGCRGYRLVYDLDFEDADSYAAATRNNAWVDPASGGTPGTSGWVPIGSSTLVSYAFAAIFDGNGHTISNLYINSSANYVGFFGVTGTGSEIRNLGLEHGSVTGGTGNSTYTGGLVGLNQGIITASYATASVTGGTGTTNYTGGLVGLNHEGSISASYATASVTGGTGGIASTGGLVGWNQGSISASYATASVTGGTDAYAGGLVGWNVSGTISASYATGSVTATGESYTSTGGLVGYNLQGSISASYATASVTGGTEGTGASAPTGGLVGWNDGTIIASYATASVTGGGRTGGLVGYNSGTMYAIQYYDSTVNAALNAIGFDVALAQRQMFLERRLLSCRLRQPTAQQATRCTMNGTEI